jgi:serine/threonine protein kinase
LNLTDFAHINESFFYHIGMQANIPRDIYVKDEIETNGFKSGPFTQIDLDYRKLPRQGWKIHVSCFYHNYQNILDIVSEYCFHKKITFKYVHNKSVLISLLEKSSNRNSAGKFITIYPNNTEEFKKIISDLYQALMTFEGPYILTDKRYSNCKVLYYRYGLINPERDVNEEYLLFQDGSRVRDLENCIYFKPKLIEDPFVISLQEESKYIGIKYMVEGALTINNGGGIYIARSMVDNKKVILKEARPYTGISSELTSIYYRKNEKDILEITSDNQYTPKLIDEFWEWEHYFIVVEYIEGKTLNEYSSSIGPAIFHPEQKKELLNCYKEIKDIFINILDGAIELRKSGIVLGDISPDNIIINKNKITFIDLEDAHLIEERQGSVSKKMGYYNKNFDTLTTEQQENQKLGYVFLNIFSNSNMLLYLDSTGKVTNRIFYSFAEEYRIPMVFVEIISKLIDGTNVMLENLVELLKKDNLNVFYQNKVDYNYLSLEDEIFQLEETIKYHSTHKYGYPVNAPTMNKFSLLNGYPLISLFGGVDEVSSFKLEEERDISLSNGISGYLVYLCMVNKPSEIFKYTKIVDNQIDTIQDTSLRNGLAGIGLSYLFIYKKLQDKNFLNRALFIESMIREDIFPSGKEIAIEKDTKLDLLDGLLGISVFYTYLYECTLNEVYLKISKKVIEKIMSYKKNIFKGCLIPTQVESNILSPYVASGTAGLIKAGIRYLKNTNNQELELKNSIKSLLNGIDTKFVTNPTYFYGLAGIGDTFIDAYNYFNNPLYLKKAQEIFKSLQLFKLSLKGYTYYPGDDLMNLGLDFEKGLAGILYFYKKLNKSIGIANKKTDHNENTSTEKII